MMVRKEVDILKWVSEGLSLTILPGIAYFLAFTYEKGYCTQFKLPDNMIRPDINTILVFASALWGVSALLLYLIDFWMRPQAKDPAENPWAHLSRQYLPFCILLLLLYAGSWKMWAITSLPILIAFLMDLLSAAVAKDKTKPFVARLEGPSGVVIKSVPQLSIARARFGTGFFVLFLVVYVGTFIARAMGASEAHNQKNYLVPASHPTMVVVRVYGDRAICCEVDRRAKKPLQRYAIIQLGQQGSEVFQAEQLGPLEF